MFNPLIILYYDDITMMMDYDLYYDLKIQI